jgi:photosystem II stability/assembly factor-like uncharacterized protein
MASKRLTACIASSIVSVAVLCAFLAPSALAAKPVTTPDGLWRWVSPLPHGFPASGGIASPAAGTLFIATTTPDLLVTRDGGASWSWSPTGSVPGFDTISGITFVSPSEGWAWGKGLLLHTADGGASWQLQFSAPSGSILAEVRFADPQNGWAVAGVPRSEVYEFYRTSNGGQSWTKVTPPPDYGTYFAALVPQGAGRAIIMRAIPGTNTVPIATFVWRTVDGGASWSGPSTVAGAVLLDATFASADRGWAVGREPWVWGTTDGGASWTKLHKITIGFSYSRTITHVGSDVWVLDDGGAMHSTDGGASWHSLPGIRGSSISFSSPQDGFIAAGSTYRHTTNGGRSWTRLTGAVAFGPAELSAGSGGSVWGVAGYSFDFYGTAGYLIKSSDAGKHWQRVTRQSNLSAVAAIGSDQAWAVGPKGSIIHTVDGGRHWSRQASRVGVDLTDVFFLDARHGWIGGSKGIILRTVDGGRHWVRNHTSTGGRIYEVRFADARHGAALVFPSKPYLLITDNGGRSWTKKAFSTTDLRAEAISMKDATHWLLISSGGDWWTTSDAGQSWQQGGYLPRPWDLGMPVAIARSGSRLCAVDVDGDVATSADDGVTWRPDGDLRGLVSCAAFAGDHTLLAGGGAGILTRDLGAAPLR